MMSIFERHFHTIWCYVSAACQRFPIGIQRKVVDMPAITVKNIPDNLYSQLKQSAKMHHRSINSELIVCLEKVLIPQKLSKHGLLAKARSMRTRFDDFKVTNEDLNKAKSAGRE
jgi:plasmid stability protein